MLVGCKLREKKEREGIGKEKRMVLKEEKQVYIYLDIPE